MSVGSLIHETLADFHRGSFRSLPRGSVFHVSDGCMPYPNMRMKLLGPRPPMGRILIRPGAGLWENTEWYEVRTIGRRRYIKDPVIRAWVEIRRLRPAEPDGVDPLVSSAYNVAEPTFTGPRGGRYRINSKGRKSYDVL